MTVNPEEPKKENQPSGEEKNKFTETLDSLKNSEKIEGLVNYAQSHTQETISYVLMVVGIFMMFFQSVYGGILVGLVIGYYFSKEVIHLIQNFNQVVEEQGTARSLIIGGALLALFIGAPGIFVGAAITIGLKYLLKVS